MGFFSGEEEEKEEVKIGLSEDSDEPDSGSTEVRDLDFDEESEEENNSGSNLENEVRSSMPGVETSTGSNSSSEDVSMEDIYEQNEEIKRKLDTLISQI
jgi:hypothetical protein